MDNEAAFARALLDAEAAVPEWIEGRDGGGAERRFSVYRNNVYASLVDVLAGRFPVSAKLVGDVFFSAMARIYVAKTPPDSAVLLRYGGGFADFVAGFPPATPVPYLADVVRLEWAWHGAYHAADAEPLPQEALAAFGPRAERLALTLHPSLRLVRSDYPVVTIWELAARDGEDEPVRLPAEGDAGGLQSAVRRLRPGQGQAGSHAAFKCDREFRTLPGYRHIQLQLALAGGGLGPGVGQVEADTRQ